MGLADASNAGLNKTEPYIGRFAPSPSGPLHMGSLVAAAASYLRARQNHGRWIVRIEDIDPPREVAGASDLILRTLEQFGFEWDGSIVYQSQRFDHYRETLEELKSKKLAYRCSCSRRFLREYVAQHQLPGLIYPRLCLVSPPNDASECAWRFNTGHETVVFEDLVFGRQRIQFQKDQGDFLVWRKHDLPSYQLAVTVDDLDQGITEIVRGADLLQDTACQNLLRDALNIPQPKLLHVPLVEDIHGIKLSKQTGAQPLNAAASVQQLIQALTHLGLSAKDAPETADCDKVWQWALTNWCYKPLISIDKPLAEE